MPVKSIVECSKGSILQYFQPSINYHLSTRPLFRLFLSCHLRQVLLYIHCVKNFLNMPKMYKLVLDPLTGRDWETERMGFGVTCLCIYGSLTWEIYVGESRR